MRTFVTGLIVTVVGFTYGEGWMILVGIAALVAATCGSQPVSVTEVSQGRGSTSTWRGHPEQVR